MPIFSKRLLLSAQEEAKTMYESSQNNLTILYETAFAVMKELNNEIDSRDSIINELRMENESLREQLQPLPISKGAQRRRNKKDEKLRLQDQRSEEAFRRNTSAEMAVGFGPDTSFLRSPRYNVQLEEAIGTPPMSDADSWYTAQVEDAFGTPPLSDEDTCYTEQVEEAFGTPPLSEAELPMSDARTQGRCNRTAHMSDHDKQEAFPSAPMEKC
jgi:hypothetical protein